MGSIFDCGVCCPTMILNTLNNNCNIVLCSVITGIIIYIYIHAGYYYFHVTPESGLILFIVYLQIVLTGKVIHK